MHSQSRECYLDGKVNFVLAQVFGGSRGAGSGGVPGTHDRLTAVHKVSFAVDVEVQRGLNLNQDGIA